MADNDFQEIFSSFQKVVDELRKDPAQVISTESVELAEDLVRKTAQRTDLQKEFARSLGESVVLSKLNASLQERDLLTARSKQQLTDVESDQLQSQLMILEESITAHRSIAEQLNEQVVAMGEAVGETKTLSQFEKNIVDIQIQKAKLMAGQADMVPEISKKLHEELDAQIVINQQLELGRQEVERQKLIHDRIGKVFGVNLGGIKSGFGETNSLLQTMAGRVTVIGTALGSILKWAIGGLADLRHQAGTSLQQTLTLGKTTIQGVSTAFHDGIVLSGKASAELAGGLAAHFGDLDRVTGQMVSNAAQLHVVIGLSADEATTFAANLAHVPGITPLIEKNIITTADQIARINHLAPAQVFHEMAANAELMARYGSEGQEAFAKAAAFATQIGVQLSKFDAFADRSLDVTEMIGQFTKLSSLGLDLGDPFKLAQLSNVGDIAGLQAELQQRLVGKDLSVEAIGRVRQRALEQATGFSIADLQRIAAGKAITGGTPAERQAASQQEKTDALVTSMGHLIASVNIATIALGAFSVAAALGGRGGGVITGLLGRAGRLLGFGGRAAGTAAVGETALATGAGEVATAGTATAAGGGALGALGTGAAVGGTAIGGLAAGAAGATGLLELSNKFLGTNFDTLADFARIHKFNEVTPEQQRGLASALEHSRQLRAGKAQNVGTPATPTKGVEDKLAELITLFRRGGITVVMDGRKVGALIAAAQPRDSHTAVTG